MNLSRLRVLSMPRAPLVSSRHYGTRRGMRKSPPWRSAGYSFRVGAALPLRAGPPPCPSNGRRPQRTLTSRRRSSTPTLNGGRQMAKKPHDTPMLDELETGPWPSFVTGLKRLAKDKDSVADLLGH